MPNFSFGGSVETAIELNRPVPSEGRFAIVTDVGRDPVDAARSKDERQRLRTAKSCGSGASTLASSFVGDREATVTRKPDHREEHEGNR